MSGEDDKEWVCGALGEGVKNKCEERWWRGLKFKHWCNSETYLKIPCKYREKHRPLVGRTNGRTLVQSLSKRLKARSWTWKSLWFSIWGSNYGRRNKKHSGIGSSHGSEKWVKALKMRGGGRDQIASMTETFFVNEGDLLPSQWDPGRGEGPSGHPKFLLFHK